MINRRSVVGGIVGGALAGASSHSKGFSSVVELPEPIYGPRINLGQADKIMTQLGIDALVLANGTNVYYATGLDLTSTKMGHTPSVYAIVTRRPEQRVSIVAPAFLFYYTISLDIRHSSIPSYLYKSLGQDYEGMELKLSQLALYPNLNKAPLDVIERERLQTIEKVTTVNGARSSLNASLCDALTDLGIKRGRLAVDSEIVEKSITTSAPNAKIINADNALRRIRPVKSSVEIRLMRYAAQANAVGALSAAKAVRAGANVRELRASYFSNVGKRGMRGVFMVIDRVSSPTYDVELYDGQCFSIDCVSEYMGYHGDFARAVHIGEPTKAMRNVSDLTGKAWDALRARIKPGMRFSEIRAMGKGILKRMGAGFSISFTPHSVGLYHSDHVGSNGSGSREDIMLEPNMIISIDCPMGATGMGGSSHLEDLMLITESGAQPINDIGSQIIMV
jgi:Xaa-Pro aminopeptidase